MAKGRAVFIRKSVGIEILLRQIFVQDRARRLNEITREIETAEIFWILKSAEFFVFLCFFLRAENSLLVCLKIYYRRLVLVFSRLSTNILVVATIRFLLVFLGYCLILVYFNCSRRS